MKIKRFNLRIKETNASIICEERFFKIACDEVLKQRKELEKYIKKDPIFLKTLNPYTPYDFAPKIAKKMAIQSTKVGVGPMASVAGAIAYYSLKTMIQKGASFAIFENGGDIAMFVDRPVNVGIYSGEKVKDIALKIMPEDRILGICTSSGKMGHSLSFGKANSVTVISYDPILADAAATAICNMVQVIDTEDIKKIMEKFLIPQIKGIIVIIDNLIGLAGDLPQIINLKTPYNLITVGKEPV